MTGSVLLAALLAGAGGALAVWGVPRRRRGGAGREKARARARGGGDRVASWVRRARGRRRARPLDATALALACTGAASRLRAGASPADAWAAELGPGDRPVQRPTVGDAAGWPGRTGHALSRTVTGAGRPLDGVSGFGLGSGLGLGLDGPGPTGRAAPAAPAGLEGVPEPLLALVGSSAAADGAAVACAVAARCGAPLAHVLDACAAGVAEAAAADAERRRARAGPATTARMLAWLPLAALGLGALLGADVVGVVRAGGWPALAVGLGAVLLALGHAWTRALVRAAAREPTVRPRTVGVVHREGT
ncbi:hypothetical protein [Miniimonas sp. S16]|uniref:hypothetical protein n=1 Tax=Miniimonas sp. S16 TaxID=2171623 RepID=UPI00131F0939|nr:hypothetical protein [Miniimonas sp. S16]